MVTKGGSMAYFGNESRVKGAGIVCVEWTTRFYVDAQALTVGFALGWLDVILAH